MFWSTRKPNGLILFLILAGGIVGVIYPFYSTGRTPLQVKQAEQTITQLLSLSGAPMVPLSKIPPFKNAYAQEAWNDAEAAGIPPTSSCARSIRRAAFRLLLSPPPGRLALRNFYQVQHKGLVSTPGILNKRCKGPHN